MCIKYLQIAVLGISLFGTALIFFNSPFVDSNVWLGSSDESPSIYKKDKKKRRLARIGFGLLLLSYLLQTIIVFIN